MKTAVHRYHVIFNVNCNNVFCFFLNELSNDIKNIWNLSNFYFGCHGNGPNCVGAVWGRFESGSEALNTYIGIINACAKFHACTLNSTKFSPIYPTSSL